MAGNEWVIRVSADVKEVLDASRQIGQAGRQAGQNFQEGFGGSDRTLDGLRGKLNELNQTLNQAVIGSKEFKKAQSDIVQIQNELSRAVSGSENTLNGLRSKLSILNQTLDQSVIGSKEYKKAQSDIAQAQSALNQALSGGENTLNGLRSKLNELNQSLGQSVIGSTEYKKAQQAITLAQGELDRALSGGENTLNGLRSKLNSLNQTLSQSVIGSKEYKKTQQEIVQVQKELDRSLRGSENTISGLRGKLGELNQSLDQAVIGSKEFRNAQKEIAQTQKQLDGALGRGNQILNAFKDGLKGLALQAGGALTVAAALQATAQQVNELDKASAAVRTLGVNSKELSGKLLDLSIEVDSNISRVDLMKASYDVASSGFSTTAQITDILRASTLGATGGFAELEDVTKAVTGVLNAYGLSTNDATQIVDGFVRTQADGVLTVREYAAQIGTVASVAAAAGIPISELNAAIATATLKGVPVEQTFTGLRQAITSILKPSAEATQLAKSLGISFDLAGLKARGFGGLLADIQTKTGGAADKLAILLGSVEAQAVIQPIINDDLKKYNELLGNQDKAQGEAAKSAKIATSTISGGFEKIQNAASNLATTLNTTLPEIDTYASALARAINLQARFLEKNGTSIQRGVKANALPQLTVFEGLEAIFKRSGVEDLLKKVLQPAKELLITSKETTNETEKQKTATDETNKAKEKQAKIQQDLHDLQLNQNRLSLIELDNSQKLEASKSKLYKAQSDAQTQLTQAGLNLGQALIGLEDSRFSIIRNRNSYELQKAQERGASEAELNAIKRRGEAIELSALNAKYAGLVRQQDLQVRLLNLQQQQALLEANTQVLEARSQIKEADLKLEKARLENKQEEIDKAKVDKEIAENNLQIAITKQSILAQTQPLEQQSANASREMARNGLVAEAASKGLALAADGTFRAVRDTAGQFRSVGDSLKVPLKFQGAFADLARDVGLQVRDTGKGYVEIGAALSKSSAPAANNIKNYMAVAAKATGSARNQAAGLATNMNSAANAANAFYNSLSRAAGLPPARFTGGPVDAGQTYRINDGPSGLSLGQEAFLSASGALSLINRPLNSLWTAPSRGVVIPAAVTSRLKDRGILGGAGALRAGADPSVAQLALAVGNLSQEVAELRQKAWNVSVGVRGDGSSLRLMQTMQRMR